MRSLFHAWGDEFTRVDGRGQDLLDEADPRTTTELLADWEFTADLPGDCLELGATLGLRRAALTRRITEPGGYTPQDYIDHAAAVGFAITVEEFTPSTPGDPAGEPAWDLEWWYVLMIHAPEETVTSFRAGANSAGDPLRMWGNDVLECVMWEFVQAHVELLFAYDL